MTVLLGSPLAVAGGLPLDMILCNVCNINMREIEITAGTIAKAETRTGRYATSDKGGLFDVIAFLPQGAIVRGRRTGVLGLLRRTGHTVRRDGQTRVQIFFARDTGDVAGTLSFGESTTRGVAPADVFK